MPNQKARLELNVLISQKLVLQHLLTLRVRLCAAMETMQVRALARVVVDAGLKALRKADAGQTVPPSPGAKDVAASQIAQLVAGVLAKAGQAMVGQMRGDLAIKAALKAKAVRVLDVLTLVVAKVGVAKAVAEKVAGAMRVGVILGHVLARGGLLAAGVNRVVVSHLLAVNLRVQAVGLAVQEGKKVALDALRVRQRRAN